MHQLPESGFEATPVDSWLNMLTTPPLLHYMSLGMRLSLVSSPAVFPAVHPPFQTGQ